MKESMFKANMTFGPEKLDLDWSKIEAEYLAYLLNSDKMQKFAEEGARKVYALASTDTTRLTEERQTANAEYIYDYLSDRGWTREAICGLLGNIQQESWFNPGVWQNRTEDKGDVTLGYGLVQWSEAGDKILMWMDITADQADFLARTDANRLMDMQLEHLISSCQWGKGEWLQKNAVREHGSPYQMSFDEFISSTNDPGELALVFHGHYERSADDNTRKQNRIDFAHKWYTYFINR